MKQTAQSQRNCGRIGAEVLKQFDIAEVIFSGGSEEDGIFWAGDNSPLFGGNDFGVNRLALSQELPDMEKYRKLL